MTISCGLVLRDFARTASMAGLELAAVEEDAVARAAVVDVDVAQHDLRQAAGAGGAGGLVLGRDRRRARRAAQQRAQARELLLGQLAPRA